MPEATYRPGDIAMVSPNNLRILAVVKVPGNDPAEARWEFIHGGSAPIDVEVGPVLGNVTDIAELRGILAEVDLAHLPVQLEEARAEAASLARWKEEAMPVMDGLQELGKALHIPLGQRITGPAALEAVNQLRTAAQDFLDAYDRVGCEVWWPDEVDPLRKVLDRMTAITITPTTQETHQ